METYIARSSDLSCTINICKSLKAAETFARAEVEGDVEEARFQITYFGKTIAQESVPVDDGIATATLRAQSPRLWYHHSYGAQPLYLLTATLLHQNTALDVCQKPFGIRRVEIVQNKLKKVSGKYFYFEVNNVPIFCGGSNWIPANNCIPRIGAQKYRDGIRMAVESNQIMLHVWGGGGRYL